MVSRCDPELVDPKDLRGDFLGTGTHTVHWTGPRITAFDSGTEDKLGIFLFLKSTYVTLGCHIQILGTVSIDQFLLVRKRSESNSEQKIKTQ